MSWGDRILLCMWENSTTLVFGYFVIEKISGLSSGTIARINERFLLSKISDGGAKITRGCGSYVAGCTYAANASIQELCDFLKENPEISDKPMIGGKFYETKIVKLKNIPHRMGFREFDYPKYEEALTVAFSEKKGKFPVVEGQFYVNKEAGAKSTENKKGQLQEVADYQKSAV